MKSFSTRIAFAIMLCATVAACKKDDDLVLQENKFSVKITQNVTLPYTVISKDNIVFDINISPSGSGRIKAAVLSLDGVALQTADASSDNQILLKYAYAVKAEDIGKSLIFRLTATDEEGSIATKDFTIYIALAPADINIALPANAPAEIQDNATADFTIAVTSENNIKHIKAFLGTDEIQALTKETFTNPKQDSYRFTYTATVADADKTLAFTIEVMDVMGNIVKRDYSLTVKRSQTADFSAYYDVNLGAQRSTAYGPFFNASNGEVYVIAGAPAKSAGIDLVTFFSGNTTSFNIVSPTLASVSDVIYTQAIYGADAMVNWTVRNKTLIKKITLAKEDFDLVASASAIQSLYTGSSVAESETSGTLPNNTVLAFKTAAGKYGVLFLKSRSANNNTSYITVDVKVQK